MTIVSIIVISPIMADYIWNFEWSGVTEFSPETTTGHEYFRYKTYWDYLELLIVPLALAVAAWYFSSSEHKEERFLETDRFQETALQNYLESMTELLQKKEFYEANDNTVFRSIARARTLTTLRSIDGDRKGILINFIYEAMLIYRDNPVINLEGADLSGASLFAADLVGSNLRGTDLSGAILSLCELNGADLTGALLKEAILIEADLTNSTLDLVNFYKADLLGSKVTIDQLMRAGELEDAIMPDGIKFDPEIHGIKLAES